MGKEQERNKSASRHRANARRLVPPALPGHYCAREALLRSLEVARGGRHCLLVGPTGFGKTTLLGIWHAQLKERGVATAWYTVSALDQEPLSFLSMLAEALIVSGVEVDAAETEGDLAELRDALLDAVLLAIDRYNRELVIIIDDFERADNREIAGLVEVIVNTLPEHAHLVLSSRRKPDFAVSAMQARGILRVIDQTELRFSLTEIAEQTGLASDEPELSAIAERTEGWPIAVQLYCLWRRRSDTCVGLPQFNGQVAEVAEYLTSQVLVTLPDECKDLLIDISILEFAEPELIDWVRERSDSAVLLELLATKLPMLVERTDGEGECLLRIHPLILGFANGALRRDPVRLVNLHRRAAEWLWEHQRYVAAARHLIATGDRDYLFSKLADIPFIAIFMSHGAGELRAILHVIPSEIIEQLPRLQLMQALAHFKTGLFGHANTLLAHIRERSNGYVIDPAGNATGLALEGHALELLFLVYVRGAAPEIDALASKVQSLAGDNSLIWAWCENIHCVVKQLRGDLTAANQSLVRTRELYRSAGVLGFAESHLLGHSILISLAHGRFTRASELCGGGLKGGFIDSDHGHRSAAVRIYSAVIDYQRNYHERSATMVRIAMERLSEGEAWFDQYVLATDLLADVAWRQRGMEGVRQCIAEMRTRTANRGLLCIESYLTALTALYIARGDEEQALLPDLGVQQMWRTNDIHVRAQIAISMARKNYSTAVSLATELVSEGHERLRLQSEIKGTILLALAYEGLGQTDKADDAMRHGIRLAQPEQMVACFLEEGGAALGILDRIDNEHLNHVERRHVEAIRRTFARQPQFSSPNALNDKETEIVAHLAQGASNKLIARRMGLSDNTVKFHLKKIFAKLGVTDRKAAVARALEDS